jgi:hypothetical protein
MNGPVREDILHFIETRSGKRPGLMDEADVFAALDLDGDRARVFMQDYAAAFSVDLTGYEPRFHHREQASVRRPGWPFPAPYTFGVRLPVSVSTLASAARSGRWPLRYPLLTTVQSFQRLNIPLILIGLPVAAGVVVGLVRLF